MDLTLVFNVLSLSIVVVVAAYLFIKGYGYDGGAVCYVLAFFVVLVGVILVTNPDMIIRTDRKIEDSIERVNYDELVSISTNRVRKVDGAYVVVKDDNTYKELKDIEFIDDDGNIYIKSPNKEPGSEQAEEKVYVLDGKHYIDTGDGTLREVQIQTAS